MQWKGWSTYSDIVAVWSWLDTEQLMMNFATETIKVCMCVCVHVRACMHVCICLMCTCCMHTCMCMHACVNVCVFDYMCLCMCEYSK